MQKPHLLFFLITLIALLVAFLGFNSGLLLSSISCNLGNYQLFAFLDENPFGVSDAEALIRARMYSDYALSTTPENSITLFANARVAMVSEDVSSAAHYLSQVDRPHNQIINWLTGYVLYETGDHIPAVEAWKRAGSARQIIKLGIRANEEQDAAEATRLFDIAVQVDPTYPNAHYALGSAYASNGNFRLAEASLLKAIELDPDIWWYNLHLAQVYDNNNRRDQAIVYYRIALMQNPTIEWAQERLTVLDSQ